MTRFNINKLTSFLLLALSVFAVMLFGRHYFPDVINPWKVQFYFLVAVLYLVLMLLFNLMFPAYPKGLKRLKSVKLKKKHSH